MTSPDAFHHTARASSRANTINRTPWMSRQWGARAPWVRGAGRARPTAGLVPLPLRVPPDLPAPPDLLAPDLPLPALASPALAPPPERPLAAGRWRRPPPAEGRVLALATVRSDLHHGRDDDRPPLRPLVEQARGGLPHPLLDDARIVDAFGGKLLQAVNHRRARLGDQVLGDRLVDEPSGDDVGPGEDHPGLGVDRRHDVHEPVVAQLAAVAQDRGTDVADAEPVDEHHADRDRLAAPGDAVLDLD